MKWLVKRGVCVRVTIKGAKGNFEGKKIQHTKQPMVGVIRVI